MYNHQPMGNAHRAPTICWNGLAAIARFGGRKLSRSLWNLAAEESPSPERGCNESEWERPGSEAERAMPFGCLPTLRSCAGPLASTRLSEVETYSPGYK